MSDLQRKDISNLQTVRRHPMCPQCGYDLVATLAADQKRCPECGWLIDPLQVHRQPLPDDWTLGRGLRRLMLHQLARGIAAAAGWSLVLLTMLTIIKLVEATAVIALLTVSFAAVVIGAGWLVGATLSKHANDAAGIEGPLVAGIVALAAWLTIAIGPLPLLLLGWIGEMEAALAVVAGGVTATVAVIRSTLFEF